MKTEIKLRFVTFGLLNPFGGLFTKITIKLTIKVSFSRLPAGDEMV